MKHAFLRTLFLTFTLTSASAAATQAYDQSCLDELPDILERVDLLQKRIEICEDVIPGVTFALERFSMFPGPSFIDQGAIDLLLWHRRSIGLSRENSEIDVILAPRTHELWDVEFQSFGKPYELGTPYKYVVWSQRTSAIRGVPEPIMSIDATSTRVFRCADNETGGCGTFYDFQFCPDYRYPKILARRPEGTGIGHPPTMALQVAARTAEKADSMFSDYHNITLFVRAAIARVLVESCKSGE